MRPGRLRHPDRRCAFPTGKPDRAHLLLGYAVRVANGGVRVGVDVTPLLGQRTGVGQFVHSLVEGFADSTDVTLRRYCITARGWRSGGAQSSQRAPMPARPLRELWRRSNLPSIEWWTGPLDVVHGTNFVVPPSKQAVQLVSDLTTIRFPELCTPDTLQYPGLLKRAIARGAHIHTDSAFVAAEVIERFAIDPAKVHTIHLSVPNVVFGSSGDGDASDRSAKTVRTAETAEVEREAVGLTDKKTGAPYILAIGTIEPRKDYPSLLRAFASVATANPEIRLLIVGQTGWGESAFNQALAQLPKEVRARIDRKGYVAEVERTRLLRGAALLVYPSVYEGFGLPPLEAMGAGIPVVATTAGSLPEVLGDGALLVSPGDHEALAEAMQRVLMDSSVSVDLVRKGFERVAKFSPETMIDSFTQLYRALAP
jgi:glycosyltransferase involved in cell wall biosynthesis